MSESFPLQPLLDLANNRMDEAARKLGELIASEHAVEEKLALLVDYRKEYHARFVEAVRNGIGPDAWRNFSAFLGKLDDAIAQQEKAVSVSRQRTEQGQQAWVDQRNKVTRASRPARKPSRNNGSRTNTPPSNSAIAPRKTDRRRARLARRLLVG